MKSLVSEMKDRCVEAFEAVRHKTVLACGGLYMKPSRINGLRLLDAVQSLDTPSADISAYLAKNPDMSVKDKRGRTAFWYLCSFYCDSQSVPMMLKAIDVIKKQGLDIDQPCRNGTTTLMLAVSAQNKNLISLLLISGANPLLKNEQGSTARDIESIFYKDGHFQKILDGIQSMVEKKRREEKSLAIGNAATLTEDLPVFHKPVSLKKGRRIS